MRYIQLALLCFIATKIYSQTPTRTYISIDVEITKEKKPKRILAVVKNISVYPNGDSSWVKPLEKSLNEKIKLKRKVKAGTYVASVKFLIERDGSIADWRCVKDPGFEICEQVVNAIRRLPNFSGWRPVDGTKVIPYKTSAITKDTTASKNLPDSLQ